jgi:hypothetical protein
MQKGAAANFATAPLFIGKKSPRRFFQNSSFVAAGKRRDFCRLPRTSC